MYTYDDVKKKLESTGGTLSDADMKLAETNPDAAMSIINAQQNYKSATTDEDKAYQHSLAETARSTGGYSGGTAGSDYILLNTPSSYSDAETQPTYTDEYESQIQAALDKIQNTKDFTYDPTTDAAYQSAKKQYMREADRSTADTMGTSAALTGGMASTAATTAASQAGDYYKSQLSDKLPTYMDSAYQKYVDQEGMNYDTLSALSALEQNDYAAYQDKLSQYNTNRDFGYGQYTDNITAQIDAAQTSYEKAQYAKEYADTLSQYGDTKTQQNIEYWLSLYDSTGSDTYLNKAIDLINSLQS